MLNFEIHVLQEQGHLQNVLYVLSTRTMKAHVNMYIIHVQIVQIL